MAMSLLDPTGASGLIASCALDGAGEFDLTFLGENGGMTEGVEGSYM